MYDIPKLNYSYDALEPYIDAETVKIHYELHHSGYLNKLNNLLNDINYDYRFSIEELIKNIDDFPLENRGDILFNAGGVLNHNLYFSIISPNKNNQLVGLLKQAVLKEFGTFDNFKQEFIKTANLLQGSGYTQLVINPNKQLEIMNTSNQETPYIYGFIPILALDLWEHAYYLKYHNRRNEYINEFFNIIDFSKVNELYEQKIQT